MQCVAKAWTWIKSAEPAWVSAGASLVGAIFASGLVVRWYLLRKDKPDKVSGPTPALSPAIKQRLQESERILHWVQSKLHGMKIPQLPDDKRSQLASACWHVTIDHSMAIVVLVHETLHGSALALIRPLFEAYVRGMWLMYAATNEDIDRAGRDRFPSHSDIVTGLEKSHHFSSRPFSAIKNQTWNRLCSLTHTGSHQILTRLTPQGLGYNYQDFEILEALHWADMLTLLVVVAFADLTANEPLAREALGQLRRIEVYDALGVSI